MVKLNFLVCFQFTDYMYCMYRYVYACSGGIRRSGPSNLNKGTGDSIFSIQVPTDALAYEAVCIGGLEFAVCSTACFFFLTLNKERD